MEQQGEAAKTEGVIQGAAVSGIVEVPLYRGGVVAVLGDVVGGKEILMTPDVYSRGLSEFEKAAKMMLSRPPESVEEFMRFQADQVIPWEEEDIPVSF